MSDFGQINGFALNAVPRQYRIVHTDGIVSVVPTVTATAGWVLFTDGIASCLSDISPPSLSNVVSVSGSSIQSPSFEGDIHIIRGAKATICPIVLTRTVPTVHFVGAGIASVESYFGKNRNIVQLAGNLVCQAHAHVDNPVWRGCSGHALSVGSSTAIATKVAGGVGVALPRCMAIAGVQINNIHYGCSTSKSSVSVSTTCIRIRRPHASLSHHIYTGTVHFTRTRLVCGDISANTRATGYTTRYKHISSSVVSLALTTGKSNRIRSLCGISSSEIHTQSINHKTKCIKNVFGVSSVVASINNTPIRVHHGLANINAQSIMHASPQKRAGVHVTLSCICTQTSTITRYITDTLSIDTKCSVSVAGHRIIGANQELTSSCNTDVRCQVAFTSCGNVLAKTCTTGDIKRFRHLLLAENLRTQALFSGFVQTIIVCRDKNNLTPFAETILVSGGMVVRKAEIQAQCHIDTIVSPVVFFPTKTISPLQCEHFAEAAARVHKPPSAVSLQCISKSAAAARVHKPPSAVSLQCISKSAAAARVHKPPSAVSLQCISKSAAAARVHKPPSAVSLQCISKSAAAARVHKPIQDKTRAQATLFAFATSIYIHQIYGNISASFFSSAKNGRCMDGEGIATTVFTATADPWTLLTAPAPQDRTLSMPSQLVMNLQSENRTMRIP